MTVHSGFDDRAFYEADIAETRVLRAVTDVGNQTTDEDGPLWAGRYRILATGLQEGEVCWVHVGPFKKGKPLALAAAPGNKRVPLTAGAPEVYTHVRIGDSDRIGAIIDTAPAGDVDVYISRVSTRAK